MTDQPPAAPHSEADKPYVSRPEAEALLAALDEALKLPQQQPVVFQAWGIGGVGKTTLARKVKELYQPTAHVADVVFGRTEGIEEPIPLMRKLYEQIVPKDAWGRDSFWEKYDLYFETIHQLQTQPASGRGEVSDTQVKQVKDLLRLGVDVVGKLALTQAQEKLAEQLVDRGTDAAVAALSLKDSLQGLLQQHRATKRNEALQRLMLEPLPQLTLAFVEGLRQQTKQTPGVLVLDTYEKVSPDIDTWIWRTLLGNTDLAQIPVRLVITGRYCVLRAEGWRKLKQDTDCLYERTFERFDLPQTTDYLAQIGITDAAEVAQIHQVTKGLPYYLNWVREQQIKGQAPNFAEGNQEIERLLLEGLNASQKQVVQLAACCRWFDSKLIRHLTEQAGLDFATAADESMNCFGWLTQQSFAEPVGNRWRLDDVARDVFRLALWHEDEEAFERVHTHLTDYFQMVSDRKAPPEASPADKYENPDWREARAEFLYHLLFTQSRDINIQFVSHLLEARYFWQDEVVQTPFQAVTAEYPLLDHPHLNYLTRKFLNDVRPAVEHGWAILDRSSLNYEFNEKFYGISKTETDTAVKACLAKLEDFEGLARFAALLYKANRCPEDQQNSWLIHARDQATAVLNKHVIDKVLDTLVGEIGPSLRRANLYEDAIAAYDKALEIKPDLYEAWYNRGIALDDLGRFEDAIAAYDKALEIKPDKHEAWYNRGIALFELDRFDDAIAAYNKALEIKPDFHEAWNNRGNPLFELGRFEDAIAAYNKALEIKPDDHEAWNNRGIALGKLGRFEDAIAAYDKALEIKPDKHEAWNNRGIALRKLGRFEDAIASYDKAIEIKPDKDEAWDNRGVAFNYLGNFEEALVSFNEALKISPNYANTLYNKSCCYGLQGNADNALDFLQKAISQDGKYREMAKTDSDFDSIRGDARLQALLNDA